MSDTNSALIDVAVTLTVSSHEAYQAWVDPLIAAQWWGGWPAGKAPEMTFEAHPGGNWRFAMAFDDQEQWVGGKVLSLDPGKQVVLDFAWEGAEEPMTPVTLSFRDLPEGGSTLTLHHDQSAGGNACADGWNWSLGCLREYFAART